MKRGRFEATEVLNSGTFAQWMELYRRRKHEAAYELTVLWMTLVKRDKPFPRVSIVTYPNVGDCLINHDDDTVLMCISDDNVMWYDRRSKKHKWDGWSRIDEWPWTTPKMPALPATVWVQVFQHLISNDTYDTIVTARSPITKEWFDIWNYSKEMTRLWSTVLTRRFPDWYLSVRTNPLLRLRREIAKYKDWYHSEVKDQRLYYVWNNVNRFVYPWSLFMNHVLPQSNAMEYSYPNGVFRLEIRFADYYILLTIEDDNRLIIRSREGKQLCAIRLSNARYLFDPEKYVKTQ